MNCKKVKDEEEGVIRDMREAPPRVVNDVKRIARVMAEDYVWVEMATHSKGNGGDLLLYTKQ